MTMEGGYKGGRKAWGRLPSAGRLSRYGASSFVAAFNRIGTHKVTTTDEEGGLGYNLGQ